MILETTMRILIIVDDERAPIDRDNLTHSYRAEVNDSLHRAIRNTTDQYGAILSVHVATEIPIHQIL